MRISSMPEMIEERFGERWSNVHPRNFPIVIRCCGTKDCQNNMILTIHDTKEFSHAFKRDGWYALSKMEDFEKCGWGLTLSSYVPTGESDPCPLTAFVCPTCQNQIIGLDEETGVEA